MISSERWKKKGEERRVESFDVGVVGKKMEGRRKMEERLDVGVVGKKRKVGVRIVLVVWGLRIRMEWDGRGEYVDVRCLGLSVGCLGVGCW